MLTGRMAAVEIRGATEKGCYTMVKPSTSESKLTATQAQAIRTAAKNILHVIANSNAMNGDYTYGLAPWETWMYIGDGVICALLALWGLCTLRKAKKQNPKA